MSKASEWASASMRAIETEVIGFEAMGIPTMDSGREYLVRAAVGHRAGQPKLCMTDYRLGSLQLAVTDAVALARWILDTFGDEAAS